MYRNADKSSRRRRAKQSIMGTSRASLTFKGGSQQTAVEINLIPSGGPFRLNYAYNFSKKETKRIFIFPFTIIFVLWSRANFFLLLEKRIYFLFSSVVISIFFRLFPIFFDFSFFSSPRIIQYFFSHDDSILFGFWNSSQFFLLSKTDYFCQTVFFKWLKRGDLEKKEKWAE